jgi:hypothetical protein
METIVDQNLIPKLQLIQTYTTLLQRWLSFQSSLFNGPISDISILCSISLPTNLFTCSHDIASSVTESHAYKLLRCNCHRANPVVSICHADGQILLLVHMPQPTTLEYPNTSFQSPCYRVIIDAIKVAAGIM